MTQPGGSGPDPIGDFQRWLLRSSAKGVTKQVTGQLRSAFGRNQPTGDVWESATADPTPEDAPECAWCPMCRAARLIRASRSVGGGTRVPPVTDARVKAVSDALGTVVQDAFSVLESALAATGRAASGGDNRRSGAGSAQPGADSQAARFPAAGQAAATDGHASRSSTAEAGQGPGDEPPGPLGGSPREPDDRG